MYSKVRLLPRFKEAEKLGEANRGRGGQIFKPSWDQTFPATLAEPKAVGRNSGRSAVGVGWYRTGYFQLPSSVVGSGPRVLFRFSGVAATRGLLPKAGAPEVAQ